MCRARRSGCRSPGSPLPRQRSARTPRARRERRHMMPDPPHPARNGAPTSPQRGEVTLWHNGASLHLSPLGRGRERSERVRGRNSLVAITSALVVLLLIASAFMTSAAFAATRTRQIIRYDSVAIEVITEGQGPAILLLPSVARDSEDYDAVAEGLADAGF